MKYSVRITATFGFDVDADGPVGAREEALSVLRRMSSTDDTAREFTQLAYPFVEPSGADSDYPSLEIEPVDDEPDEGMAL